MGAQTITVPRPGSAFGNPTGGRRPVSTRSESNTADELNPLVKWSRTKKQQFEAEAQPARERQRRNREYYAGRQTFKINERPKWMNSIVVNDCFYVIERWTALLTDNKPKVVFSAYKKEDQLEADVANAAFDDDYDTCKYGKALKDAVKLSRLDGNAFIRQTYDPRATPRGGRIVWRAVSGRQVYVNAEATSIHDATTLLYTYVEPTSMVLARWPKLRGQLRTEDKDERPNMPGERRTAPASTTTPLYAGSWAPGSVGDSYGAQQTAPGYAGVSTSAQAQTGSGRVIDEWWVRHPAKTTRVDSISWAASGDPVTEQKTICYYDEDGQVIDEEPLVTVVTEGNIVYEWPLSTALTHQHVGDHFGGLKVIKIIEARTAVTQKKTVPLYPGGRRVVIVDGRHLASDGNNPFTGGHWPFSEIVAYSSPDSFGGLGDVDVIKSPQDGRNRLVSQIMNAADMTANPIWRLPYGRKTPNEMITNAPGAIIDEDITSLRYGKRERGPDMPSYVLDMVKFYGGEMSRISGVSDVGMGGKFKGNQAAETVSMYQDSASLPARSALQDLEGTLEELGSQWVSLASQFYGEPRWVFTREAVATDQSHVFVGTKLSAPMRIKATAGSRLPQSPSAQLGFVMQLMNTPFGNVDQLARALENVGLIDSASEFVDNIKRYVDDFQKSGGNPITLWGAPGLMQLLGGGGAKKKQASGGRTSRQKTPRPQG